MRKVNYSFITGGILLLLLIVHPAFSQNGVGINANGAAADSSAMLDVVSSAKGALLPRMSLGQMYAIPNPATGLIVYVVDDFGITSSGYYYYNGIAWVRFIDSSSGSLGWLTAGNSGTSPGTNFIGTTDVADFVIKTSSSEVARFKAGGNFGIGTNNPLEMLHVLGNIRASSLAGTGTRIVQADSNGTMLPLSAGTSSQVLLGTGVWGSVPGDASNWTLTGNAGTNASTNFIGTTDSVDFVIKTKNVENFRSYASGKMIAMGIGAGPSPATTSNVASLILRGANGNFQMNVQDGGVRGGLLWNATGSLGVYETTGEPTGYIGFANNGTTSTDINFASAAAGTAGNTISWTQLGRLSGSNQIWLSPRGTSSDFYISSAGLVGVGTSSPAAQVDVSGNTSITSGNFSAVNVTGHQTTASTGGYFGLNVTNNFNAVSGNTLSTLIGIAGNPQNSSTGTVTAMYGVHGVPTNTSTGTVGTMYAVDAHPTNSNSGTVTNAYAFLGRIENTSSGTISNAYGLYIDNPNNTGTITNKYAIITNSSAGNVGIGTTAPAEALVTAGNILAGNINAHTQLYSGYDAQSPQIIETGYGTATSANTPYPMFVLSKNITGTSTYAGGVSWANSGIANGSEKRLAHISGLTDGAINSGMFEFFTVNAGVIPATADMVIKASGNVGIGTVTPAQKLQVMNGNIDLTQDTFAIATASAYSSSTIGTCGHFYGLRGGGTHTSPSHPLANYYLAAFEGRNAITPAAYSGMIIQASENQSNTSQGSEVFFLTTPNGTVSTIERMRITNTGSVGIGTTAPGNTGLTIDQTTSVTSDYRALNTETHYNGGSAMTNFYGVYVTTPAGTGTITNKYALVSEAGAGKVGIGMIAPSTTFHSAGQVSIGIPSGGLGGASATTGSLQLYNSSNGNTVAIQSGVTSPSYTLTMPTAVAGGNNYALVSSSSGVLNWANIAGGSSATNWAITGNGSISASTAAIGSTVNNNFIGTTDGNDFVLATNNLERMRITSAGNIGIGTTTPGSALTLVSNSANTASNYVAATITGMQTTANTANFYGLNVTNAYSATTGNTLNALVGVQSNPRNLSTGTITAIYGLYGLPQNTSTGSVTAIYGALGLPQNTSTGSVTNLIGVYGLPQNTNGGAVTNLYGVDAIPQNTGAGTVTTAFALYGRVDNTNASGVITNAYGAYIGTPTATGTITNKYALVTELSAGFVGFGTTTPNMPIHVQAAKLTDGSLNAQVQISDNAAYNANPIGGLKFIGQYNSSSQYAGWGGLTMGKANTTDGDYSSYMAFHTRVNGSGITERMRIDQNGNVGIGCTAPQYTLHVIGDIASSATVRSTNAVVTGAITACSDIRFKKEISPLTSALDNVMKLQGVNYYWKKDEFPDRNFNDKKQIGFIAQEIEKIYPEVVLTDVDGYKAVDYSKLTPILVEAIKEQQKKIDDLSQALSGQTDKNAELKKQFDDLQSQINQLSALMKQSGNINAGDAKTETTSANSSK